MCGITGIFSQNPINTDQKNMLDIMTGSLAHRGPDGGDVWTGESAGLGHRRLAIIDLHTGHQPMHTSNGDEVIVFNGEIYNYPELRKELESRGHVFKTASDTEVIPAALREWGIKQGLLKLRGMFAFALFNTRTKTLLLARDRTGIKPIYWAKKDGAIYFASESKSLLESGAAGRVLDPVSLHDYLQVGYAITPRTIWKDIQFLPPASWMEVTPDGERFGTYWEWTAQPNTSQTESQWLDEFESIFSDALRCHLLSDVPLGAFLSGGIDSSLVVAMLSRHHVKGLNTFNVAFDEKDFNESPFAKLVADQYQTHHQEILVSLKNADPNVLMTCLAQFDEPFGDTASLPNYLLSKATAQRVKVVISGDGGDEILGGYPFYQRLKYIKALNQLQWADPAIGPVMRRMASYPLPLLQKISRAWQHAEGSSAKTLVNAIGLRNEDELLYTDEFKAQALREGSTYLRTEKYLNPDLNDPLDEMFTFEMRLRLNSGYLRKVDITSSAHGLETRVPFLDNAMLEFAERLPSKWKVHNRQPKYLGYQLAKKYLPAEVTNRKKHGFNFPFDHWSNTPTMSAFLKDLVVNKNARWREFLKDDLIQEPWDVFTQKKPAKTISRYDAYARVYSIVSLEVWLKKWNATL